MRTEKLLYDEYEIRQPDGMLHFAIYELQTENKLETFEIELDGEFFDEAETADEARSKILEFLRA